MQLINGDGEFNMEGLEQFIKEIRLADCGLSYAVVSIMGPQSSGRSTFLNHLFKTNFREMDAYRGRSVVVARMPWEENIDFTRNDQLFREIDSNVHPGELRYIV